MEETISNTIKTYERLMKLIAIWPLSKSYFLYDLFRYINVGIIAAVGCSLIVDGYLKIKNIENAAYALSFSVAVFQAIQKISIVFLKKNKIKELLQLLTKPPLDVQEDFLKNYLRKKLAMSSNLRNLFLGCSLVTVGVEAIAQLLSTKNVRGVPLPCPIDLSTQPFIVYAVVWVLQCSGAFLIVWSCCLIDSLVFTLIWVAVAHCEILNHKIFFAPTIVRYKLKPEESNSNQLNKYLEECAVYHTALEKCVKLIEGSFMFIFLLSMESLIPICLMGLSFITAPVSSTLFGSAFFFMSGVLEFSLFCMPGDELIYQSKRIIDSSYGLGWEDYDPNVRKTLFLIMERAKRPFFLTTAKLAKLSVESLIAFLKAALSYFMVLWHLYHDTDRKNQV